jgi:hypothetical protein
MNLGDADVKISRSNAVDDAAVFASGRADVTEEESDLAFAHPLTRPGGHRSPHTRCTAGIAAVRSARQP